MPSPPTSTVCQPLEATTQLVVVDGRRTSLWGRVRALIRAVAIQLLVAAFDNDRVEGGLGGGGGAVQPQLQYEAVMIERAVILLC